MVLEEGGQLVWVTSPVPRGLISQARHHLEDPDKGVWTTDRPVVLHHSEAKEEIGECGLCFKC